LSLGKKYAKIQKDYGLDYLVKDVIVSSGAKQSLTNALMAIVNPGEEVIVPVPCWMSYLEMIKLTGGIPVLVNMDEKSGFDLDVKKISAHITDKTKAILINSPIILLELYIKRAVGGTRKTGC